MKHLRIKGACKAALLVVICLLALCSSLPSAGDEFVNRPSSPQVPKLNINNHVGKMALILVDVQPDLNWGKEIENIAILTGMTSVKVGDTVQNNIFVVCKQLPGKTTHEAVNQFHVKEANAWFGVNLPVYNAFEGTQLAETLKQQGVTTVVVVGWNQELCVRETCKGALAAGFNVVTSFDTMRADENDTATKSHVRRWYRNHTKVLPFDKLTKFFVDITLSTGIKPFKYQDIGYYVAYNKTKQFTPSRAALVVLKFDDISMAKTSAYKNALALKNYAREQGMLVCQPEQLNWWSAFDSTNTAKELKAQGVDTIIVIGGRKTSYVMETCKDGLKNGFQVISCHEAMFDSMVNTDNKISWFDSYTRVESYETIKKIIRRYAR